MNICDRVRKELFALQEVEYQAFTSKLIPSVSSKDIIGVRVPILKKLGKNLWEEVPEQIEEYLNTLPHMYLEENHLHAFLIGEIKDYSVCIKRMEEFLPSVDNWATCDIFSPKILKKYPEKVLERIEIWLNSDHVYTKRYAVGVLLSNYLDERFQPEILERVSTIKTEEYYLQMMIAWYFATALAKQYEATIPYLEKPILESWIHNKTIQKAIESRRVTEERKNYLRSLKRKTSKHV